MKEGNITDTGDVSQNPLDQLVPRDYRGTGGVLQKDFATLLKMHPEAFDCLIFPAMSAEHDETVAVDADPVGALDSGERAQTYGEAFLGRAIIVPEESLTFDVMSARTEDSFFGASEAINIMLSHAVRTYSLIQWYEYPSPEAEEPVLRTVYINSVKPAKRITGAGVVYICLPLPAMSEVPSLEPEPEPEPEVDPEEGTGEGTEGDVSTETDPPEKPETEGGSTDTGTDSDGRQDGATDVVGVL